MTVSKDKPLAFYLQVANKIKEDILTGTFKGGQSIGSQQKLCDQFGVSRITIRKAIEVLTSENLVTTIHGKGTFVKHDKVEQQLDELKSLTDIIKTHGYKPQVRVIKKESRKTSQSFADSAPNDLDCLYIERVHSLENEVIAIAQAYIPNVYGSKISKDELESKTIYELLENKFNIELGEADQSIEACPASQELSEILNVDVGTPLLKAKRLVFSSDNQLIEKIIFYYRYDAFAFKVKLNSISITPMWPTK